MKKNNKNYLWKLKDYNNNFYLLKKSFLFLNRSNSPFGKINDLNVKKFEGNFLILPYCISNYYKFLCSEKFNYFKIPFWIKLYFDNNVEILKSKVLNLKNELLKIKILNAKEVFKLFLNTLESENNISLFYIIKSSIDLFYEDDLISNDLIPNLSRSNYDFYLAKKNRKFIDKIFFHLLNISFRI